MPYPSPPRPVSPTLSRAAAVGVALVWAAAAVAQTCTTYGLMTYCTDGTIYTRHGNTIYDNYGNIWRLSGTSIYDTDGTSTWAENVLADAAARLNWGATARRFTDDRGRVCYQTGSLTHCN